MTDGQPDYLNDWNGHDALIQSVAVDITQMTVTVRLLAYPNETSRDRQAVEFVFSNVETVTTSAHLERLAENAFAGTVNHWRLAEGPGASFFYLTEGYLSVTARSAFEFRELKPGAGGS